jgi:hypothetical protein
MHRHEQAEQAMSDMLGLGRVPDFRALIKQGNIHRKPFAHRRFLAYFFPMQYKN